MKTRIGKQWDAYLRTVVPAGAGRAQVRDTKNAFYAGAATLLATLMGELGPESEATGNDLKAVDEIAEELKLHLLETRSAQA